MNACTRSLVFVTASAAFFCCQPAAAEERNPLDAHFIGDLGWFFLSTDTHVRVNGQTTHEAGTDVNYDDTFGLGDYDRFRVDLLWRFANRHSIRLMYFQNNRSGSRELSRDVVFGDQTYPLGATVHAESKFAVAQLAYDYAFLRKDSWELAGSFGIHALDLKLALDATVTNQSGSTATRSVDQSAKTTAPLPVIGLRGMWRLSQNFYLTAQAQYFYLKFDPYSGGLSDLKAAFVWQPTNHFGLGAGYNGFGFHFDINKSGFDGRLRWNYGGAIVFASFMF